MLASLWRILCGEQLKIGDEKLEQLFFMMEVLMEEIGNPLTAISMEYPWLFKLFNGLGILQTIPYHHSLMKFIESVLISHKRRQIDGNFIFSVACIFLLLPLDLAYSELTCVFHLVTTLLLLTLALSSSRAQQNSYHMVVLS